jgi:hypothetical protein
MKKAPHDKNSYRELLNLHNTWDDLDVNNISEHRINVTEALMDLEIEFKNSYKCECE